MMTLSIPGHGSARLEDHDADDGKLHRLLPGRHRDVSQVRRHSNRPVARDRSRGQDRPGRQLRRVGPREPPPGADAGPLGRAPRRGRSRLSPTGTIARDVEDTCCCPTGRGSPHRAAKTGTTALQAAFDGAARSRQGVHYASHGRHAMTAVLAGIEQPSPWTARSQAAVEVELGSAPQRHPGLDDAKRVVLSSEFFADATPRAIRRVVERDRAGADPDRGDAPAARRNHPLASGSSSSRTS